MRIEKILQSYMDALPASNVRSAMEYSLMAGGKRIRPNLLYTVLRGYGVDEAKGDCFASALEMIHTYSLIHDDLPAMDNDDLRRGRPTCHKQFDEATAILAGDGLLTYAFQVASASELPAEVTVQCIHYLAKLSGIEGMIHGQDLDMNESETSDWKYLKTVHYFKTGCLLSVPLMMAATIAGKDNDCVLMWHQTGSKIGLAFQIQDDILDVELTPEEFGKSVSDEDNHKVTSVTLLGKEKAEEMMNQLYEEAEESIRNLTDFNGSELIEMIEEIRTRRK